MHVPGHLFIRTVEVSNDKISQVYISRLVVQLSIVFNFQGFYIHHILVKCFSGDYASI